MREFVYGVILGASAMWLVEYFDAAGTLAYLNSATQSAVESTSGYGGRDAQKASKDRR